MRQVPTTYAVIGNGRMARHIIYYFSQLNISVQHWHRRMPQNLTAVIADVSHVLLLISDSQIDAFIEQHPELLQKCLIHFSGALVSQYAHTAHPLMTFSQQLYPAEFYATIPFILEAEGPSFNELFPQLSNPNFTISRDKKAYYHALCVMANNFTTLLWQKIFSEFSNEFSFPSEVAMPLMQQTVKNLMLSYKDALTGPLVRNDQLTIQKNLQALQHDNYLTIYQAFVDMYQRGQYERT